MGVLDERTGSPSANSGELDGSEAEEPCERDGGEAWTETAPFVGNSTRWSETLGVIRARAASSFATVGANWSGLGIG